MKILLINVTYGFGSTGRIVKDICDYANRNGETAIAVFGRGPAKREENVHRIACSSEVGVHVLLARLTGLNGFFSPLATFRLLRLLDRTKPDIVHLHELHGYYLNVNAVVRYLARKRIKAVWTFHCEYMYTGKCGITNDCEKWKTVCGECPQLHEYPKSWFFDFSRIMQKNKRNALSEMERLLIVTPSEWLRNQVSMSFLSRFPVEVVNNGIDTSGIFHIRDVRALRERLGIGNERVVLAVAPHLMSSQKGGEFILELARDCERHPFIFIMIGLDDPGAVNGKNVMALGRINDPNELAEYYSLASVFVICSKKETFSLTCAESLSCGTPVIGFKSGGPEEISLPDYSSFVEYGDIHSLKEKLLMWVGKKDGESGKIAAAANKAYSKETMCRKYLECYRTI